MNFRIIIPFLLCLFLCACVPKKYGNFLIEPIETGTIITGTVAQMTEYFPPAKTKLDLSTPPISDKFGTELIKKLRVAGYALFENQSQESKREDTLAFSYIIDTPVGPPQFVRLTLFIGSETMSCGYDSETLQPISMWSKGEL